jgi:hypothetical protein
MGDGIKWLNIFDQQTWKINAAQICSLRLHWCLVMWMHWNQGRNFGFRSGSSWINTPNSLPDRSEASAWS